MPASGGLLLVLAALIGAALLTAVAAAARSAAGALRPEGLLPAALRGIEVGSRAAALIAVAWAGIVLLPDGLRALVPWVGGAMALAVGWSARDVLQDWIAWGFLASEGHLRPGAWVRGETFEGVVRALRPRVLWIVDERGTLAAVPNRLVARSVLQFDADGHPEVSVELDLPGVAPATARRVLEEAAWLSPWLAPGTAVRITSGGPGPERWAVRLRIVELACRDRFLGTFRERVGESLDRLGSGANAGDL
jgi:Mechanosensitive ion channel